MYAQNPIRPSSRDESRSAFTLAELLIVITVIVLLFTIIAPSFKQLLTTGTRESATSTVGVAATTIRSYATKTKAFNVNSYQGTALIFTPANEIRFVISDDSCVDGANASLSAKSPQQAGYVDVPGQDYVQLPDDTGVIGVTRGGAFGSGVVRLYTPPFAVRFNGQGNLIARTASTNYDGCVYYDGNGDGQCVVTKNRQSPYLFDGFTTGAYDPTRWDPSNKIYQPFNDATTNAGIATNTTGLVAGVAGAYNGRYKLPFEQIDSVVGVLIYSKSDLASANISLASDTTAGTNGALPAAAASWLTTNGTYIYFNRYSGAIIRP